MRGASRKSGRRGPDSKIGTLLSRVATYPSGARRRAGATRGRAIAIAGCRRPQRPRASIYAEDRDVSLCSRPLHDGRLALGVLEFSQVSALDGEHCSGYGANSGWHISIPIGWADTSKHTITVQEQRYLRGEDQTTGKPLADSDPNKIKWYVTVQYADGCWESSPYRLATL